MMWDDDYALTLTHWRHAMETTITLNGHEYTVTLARGPQDTRTTVSICRDGHWAGNGWWTGSRIEDCPADLGDEAYDALDEAVADAFARGEGAAVDPS